jgi:translation initiation factor IF-1
MVVNDKIVKAAVDGELDEDSMTYGIITKSLGHGRMRVLLVDRRETAALIRKTLRQKKSTGMGIGDIVILHCPHWEKEKASATQEPEAYIEGIVDLASVALLRANGTLPVWMGISAGTNEIVTNEVVTGGFEFDRSAPGPTEAEETLSDEEESEEEDAAVATAATTAATAAATAATKIKPDKGAGDKKLSWSRPAEEDEGFDFFS